MFLFCLLEDVSWTVSIDRYLIISSGLTLGSSVTGDPAKVNSVEAPTRRMLHCLQEIIRTAFENGINMFDTAEAYARGQSELEMSGLALRYVLYH